MLNPPLQQEDWIVKSSKHKNRANALLPNGAGAEIAGGSKRNVQRVCQREQRRHYLACRVINRVFGHGK